MANEYNDTIYPGLGQLNTDDNIWSLPQNNSRYRLNVSIDDDGDKQILVNSLGTSQAIDDSGLDGGGLSTSAKAIGFVEDIENNHGIYFIYDTVNGDRIVRYRVEHGDLQDIISPSDFDLTLPDTIIHADVIGVGDSKTLLWTDGVNPPRQINIAKAITGGYTSASEINVAKEAPNKPTAEYATDTNTNSNNLRGQLYQFSVRYKYDDNSYSIFSELVTPWASGFTDPYPNNTELNTISRTSLNINNVIELTISSIPDSVEYIDVAYRVMNISDDGSVVAVGNFYLYDTFKKETTTETYDFYNNRVSSPIDDAIVLKPYEYIPLLAKSQESINGNRIAYGGITEGYDVIQGGDVSVELTHVIEPNISSVDSNVLYTIPTTGDDVDIPLPYSTSSPRRYILTLSGDWDYSIAFSTDGFASQNAMITYVAGEVSGLTDLTGTVNGGNLRLTRASTATGSANLYTYQGKDVLPTFKPNQIVKLGLLYCDDANRSSFIVTEETSDIISPTTGTDVYIPPISSLSTKYPYRSSVMYNISHLAPEWATKWSWCMSISNISNSFKFYTHGVVEKSDRFIISLDREFTALSIDNTVVIDPYYFTPSKGDRVTLISSSPATPTIESTFYDFEILEYDSVSNEISIPKSSDISVTYITAAIIEVYSPSKNASEEQQIYYQFGGFGTVDSNRYHARSSLAASIESDFETEAGVAVSGQNQTGETSLTGCIGVLDFGNSYFSESYALRFESSTLTADSIIFFRDSLSAFQSEPYLTFYEGKPYVSNSSVGQTTSNSIRWSGILNSQSGVNNLFSFDFDDIRYLNDEYGDLYLMKQIGQTLKCYQESKVSSFGLGISEYVDANGNITTRLSDSVLDSIRLPIENYGTIHPKSFVLNDRNGYFFDVNQGVVVRDSPNGLLPVSDYKMRTFFRNISKTIKSDITNYDVVGGYDYINEMYIISIIDLATASNSATIGFHEPTNRWISFYSFVPELYGGIGGTLFVGFKNGQLYLHNDDTADRNSFYGTAAELSVVYATSNNGPDMLKIFNAVEIGSNDVWSMPNNDSIEISPTAKYPNGMASRIKPANIRNEEGLYRAEFRKDGLTYGSTWNNDAFINGRNLRGREITLKLESDSTDESKLFYVKVKGQVSK